MLLTVCVWVLAFYGLFEIIKNIVYICSYTKLNTKGIYVLIAVKNQEETIEYFLRSFLFRIIYDKEDIKNIAIVDLNSKDNTKKIIENFKREHDNITFLNWKECKELLENIKEN